MRLRLISAILGLSLFLLIVPALARADSSIGASSTSTLMAQPCAVNPFFCSPGGLIVSGGASGAGYDFGLASSLYCSGGSGWYWCSGGLGVGFATLAGQRFAPDFGLGYLDSTITQDPSSGLVSLTMNDLCNFSVGCYSFVFDLAPDPAMLSSLVPTTDGSLGTDGINFADLTVVGGCFTSSTTCSSTITPAPTPTPEPATGSLMLIGLGLCGVVMAMRMRIAPGYHQAT